MSKEGMSHVAPQTPEQENTPVVSSEIPVGMTLEEINEHLEGFKSVKGMVDYLIQILKHEDILSNKTREGIYTSLIQRGFRGDGYYITFYNIFDKAGGEGKEFLLKEAMDSGSWTGVDIMAEKMGRPELLPKVIEGYMNGSGSQDIDKAYELAEKMGEEGKKYLPKILECFIRRNYVYSDPYEAEEIADRIGKDGEKYLPRILELYIAFYLRDCCFKIDDKLGHQKNNRNIDNIDRVVRKIGNEGKKVLLNEWIKRAEWYEAEKLAESMGRESEEFFLSELINFPLKGPRDLGYREGAKWFYAEKLAEKLGKQEILPVILDGYLFLNDWVNAEKLAEKLGIQDERMANIYEHTGKVMKAKTIRKNIKV